MGPSAPLTVALLTTDNRWFFKEYASPVPQFGPAPAALIEGFANLPGVTLHIVSSTKRVMKSPEKLADNIWFHSQYVPRIGWMRSAFLGCVRATRRTLRQIRPDIVHGQGTESDCAMSAVFSGYPNVLTIHGNMRRIAKVQRHAYNWLAARLESLALPRSLGTVCLTSHTQRHVRDLARRTWIVPNAVDPSFFDIAAQPDLSVPRVLCVGTVCRLKNQLGLIHALDDIAQSFKFKLLFLGGADQADSYFGEFRTAVRDREWCEYAGFADRETLKSQLRQAALLVLPSLEENCPMVILEAMASGVPVVGARVGGIPDLIEEDKTGFFCDPLDPVSTRSAVEAALGDPPRLAVIAKTAKYRARERFHPSVIARRHLEIYREVLA